MSKRYVRANPVSVELGASSGKGTPQVVVRFLDSTTGEQFTWYGFLTEKTEERTLESLRYCGWRGADVFGDLHVSATAEVDLVLETEEWEGKTREKVAWVNRPRGAAAPVGDAQKAQLAARLRAKLAKVDAKLKAEGAAPSNGAANGYHPPEPPPPDDADLPF